MRISIKPIGVVHSSITDPSQMPMEGVAATVEVFSPFVEGLAGIGGNTHIMVVGWLHEAQRDRLKVRPWFLEEDAEERGVFSTRSPSRPNPIAVSVVRLLGVEGRFVKVEALDLVDGTPVLDIKEGSRAIDYAFSAATFADLALPRTKDDERVLSRMMTEGENFHGERCSGLALGVRMVHYAMRLWHVAPRDRRLIIVVGKDGCVADGVQGVTGATLGNKRLRVTNTEQFTFHFGGRKAIFHPHSIAALKPDEVLQAELTLLFSVREEGSEADPSG